jgi:hypothetical protein
MNRLQGPTTGWLLALHDCSWPYDSTLVIRPQPVNMVCPPGGGTYGLSFGSVQR